MSDETREAAAPPSPASATAPVTLHDQLQGRWVWGWVYAGVWLVFLVPAFLDGLRDPNRVRGWTGALVIAVFSVFYLHTWASVRSMRIRGERTSTRRRYLLLGAAVGLTVAAVLLVGAEAMAMTTFLTVLVMFLLPSPARLVGTALVIAAAAGVTWLMPSWDESGTLLGLVLCAFVMWGIVQMVERNAELRRAHERLAELTIEQERARFARDLHDLLGHSLTLLAMKAELAGRMVRLDPDRAEREIAEVERLARDALVDVRAAVGGYRRATLTGELISARAVLDAAGIDAELPAAVDDVPGERRELLGWAVREGVTNVVRHSGATRCRITVGADGVEILDDGCGPSADPVGNGWPLGSGLRGLRERAEAAGATVVVTGVPDGGFRLRVGW
jgi:two-component system, NarL family, sensor histidine kinase DesK